MIIMQYTLFIPKEWDPILDYTYNNFTKFIDAEGGERPAALGGNCIDQARNMLQPGLQAGFVRAEEWPHWVAAIDNRDGARFLFDPLLALQSTISLQDVRKLLRSQKCCFNKRSVDIFPREGKVVFDRKEWNDKWTFNPQDPLSPALPTQKELIDGIEIKDSDVFFLTVIARGNVYDVCMTAGSRKLRARGNDPVWIREQNPAFNHILKSAADEVQMHSSDMIEVMNQAADIHAILLQKRRNMTTK
jgi:hypothetical protein